jgi:hypothetical protein
VQTLTQSGEYDGTRDGTFFEHLGTTVGTAKMRHLTPTNGLSPHDQTKPSAFEAPQDHPNA